MSVTDAPTLAQVITLARRLPAADQLRLIARLASGVIDALPAEAAGDAWEELRHFSDELATLPPPRLDSAEVLSAMRR